MEDNARNFRSDLIGLAATTRLQDAQGVIPDAVLQNAVHQSFSDASNIALSRLNNGSAVAQALGNSAVDRASDWYVHQVRDRIISWYNKNALGIDDMSQSSSLLERSEDAFYKAVSPMNLLMKTGGSSVLGLRSYLREVYDQWFSHLDLAFDRIGTATDPSAQKR